jgi:hypothetical protein
MLAAGIYPVFSPATPPCFAKKRITVLRTDRGGASPVGMVEAVESRQRVSSKQAQDGRLSKKSVIPSSGD